MTRGAAGGRALPLLLVAVPREAHRLFLADLEDPRFTYHLVSTGREALRDLYRYQPDLLLLSLRLRDPGGWEVLRRVREMTEELHIVALDRRYRESAALRALHEGADDYLHLGVPHALCRALVGARLRRARPPAPASQLLDDGRLSLDIATREAAVDTAYLPLTPLEFEVLYALARNPGQVLSPDQLIQRAWRDPAAASPANVRYVVLRLRRRFEEATGAPAPIETVRGVGYRYRPPT
ncbi:winged helix-turn-helix domain-containing protein [Streptomyces sp. NPDC050095]|uniref:winged helix-turn-helix domain-containing protein n=1 Tax=unclassified Streptomyces TaxID=2593676 RepID=UPI003429CB27